jgi:hypothetical protein
MDGREIKLEFRRKDFEEAYFRNGNEKVLLNSSVKPAFYWSLLCFLLWFAVLIHNLLYVNEWQVFIFLGVITAFSMYHTYSIAYPFIKWKRDVTAYLDGVQKCREHSITISPTTFSYIQDGTTYIEKWTQIKKAEVSDLFISFEISSNYLFPRKSLNEGDYNALKAMVLENMKAADVKVDS